MTVADSPAFTGSAGALARTGEAQPLQEITVRHTERRSLSAHRMAKPQDSRLAMRARAPALPVKKSLGGFKPTHCPTTPSSENLPAGGKLCALLPPKNTNSEFSYG